MTYSRAILIGVTVLLTGCAGSKMTQSPVSKIRNSDIRWDGTYLGLQPRIIGASAKVLREPASTVQVSLIAALGDENRFVAAHVLLCKINKVISPIDASTWNGLRVELL